MGTHLKRQAGVTDASYKKGSIEVRSDATQGFQIAPVLTFVTGELGLTPVKRIEATIRGRVVRSSKGNVLEVTGTGERLQLQGAAAPTETEQLFTGVIESGRGGTLKLKIGAAK